MDRTFLVNPEAFVTRPLTVGAAGFEVASIPRLQFGSLEDLGGHLKGQTRPFIAVGCIDGWPAMRDWTPQNFSHRFACMPVTASVDLPSEGSPYDSPVGPHVFKTTMAGFVERLEIAAKPSYLHQMSATQFPGLADATNFDSILPSGMRDRKIFLWVGSAGTRSGLHFDRFDNINAQIFGRKQVFLVSPEQSGRLYPFGDNVEKSQIDPDSPDFDRFPNLAGLQVLSAIIEPGELLYIPRLWWHHLRSLQPAINVNCWFGEHVALTSILRVVQQGGPACWGRVARDFVSYGVLGMKPSVRLFSEPPTGKFLYDLTIDAIRRRLPGA